MPAKLKWRKLWLPLFGSLLAVPFIVPMIFVAVTAFKPLNEIFAVPIRWLPSTIAWDNFIEPFIYGRFDRYFLNSFIVSAIAMTSEVFFCTLGGYSLAKFRFRGRNLMFMGILAMMIVPIETIIVPLAIIVKQLGMMNSMAGLIVPVAITPFGVFWMRQYIVTIQLDYIEAARVDGMKEFRIFTAVIFPLTAPAVSALLIFSFMENWNSFIWPLIVTKQDVLRTIPVGLAAFNDEFGSKFHYIFAMTLLAVLPTLGIFLVFKNRLIKGFATIGIKG